MTGLLNYFNENEVNKIKNIEVNNLENKNKKVEKLTKVFISEGISIEQAKANSEEEIFVPEKLQKINLNSDNINFGKKIKVVFFVNEEEYKRLTSLYDVINQFEEIRIYDKNFLLKLFNYNE